MGRSRSATLFLAYLMIFERMTVVDAIEHVKKRRRIIPNWGFLKQLRELDMHLLEKRDSEEQSWFTEVVGQVELQSKPQVNRVQVEFQVIWDTSTQISSHWIQDNLKVKYIRANLRLKIQLVLKYQIHRRKCRVTWSWWCNSFIGQVSDLSQFVCSKPLKKKFKSSVA